MKKYFPCCERGMNLVKRTGHRYLCFTADSAKGVTKLSRGFEGGLIPHGYCTLCFLSLPSLCHASVFVLSPDLATVSPY